MNSRVIYTTIRNIIDKYGNEENAIFVLKGIPLSLLESEIYVSAADVVANRLAYFMKLSSSRKIISYEEFLLLSDLLLLQYNAIIIIDNNLFMNQYPIEEIFPRDIRESLLTHFSDTEGDEDAYIGNIDDYVSMFNGLTEDGGVLIGAYIENRALDSERVRIIDLYQDTEYKISMRNIDRDNEYFDIVEEEDFVRFTKSFIDSPRDAMVCISNYTGDLPVLMNHLKLLAFYWKDEALIELAVLSETYEKFKEKTDFHDILKRFWGYDSFRNMAVYDMQELERGNKQVRSVSQEQIIDNLVRQVENCGEGKDFRDLFVTAPTGSGKSVMFQIPAIYLAEKYNLLTIVISPLIGLMNDQVKGLELRNYSYAKTINSDVSPIIKQDIIDKVADSQYHILYISPETLLSRSDVEQLIGDRTIGMIVIDEAHIVTTWGKQFRPDYWYLGDHIRKLRKNQIRKTGRSFVIATFTATAIYHGVEDMYMETLNSLHMLNPITYLGFMRRDDIDIVINRKQKDRGEREEYELDKFEQIEQILFRAMITNKKTLVYFPTVALINRCYEYLKSKHEAENITLYYGPLDKDIKLENYEDFYSKRKLVMFATKAFGMGIDIDDIELVVHFAPTGNVCDYVQEIGRAARRPELRGEAYYHYNNKDFRHINRLHGLSTIQRYQLVKVIEKITEIYTRNIRNNGREATKRRNALLLDAENFTYIFESSVYDEATSINKVKTALLLIQKDFEAKIGFSPITVRPIPMFSIGFFQIEPSVQKRLNRRFIGSVEEIDQMKHICRVFLSDIWKSAYNDSSFPKFKYMLYSHSPELDFWKQYPMKAALMVNIELKKDYSSIYAKIIGELKKIINDKIQTSVYVSNDELADELSKGCKIHRLKAKTVCEVIIASMSIYRKYFSKTNYSIAQARTVNNTTKYQFNVAVGAFFSWLHNRFEEIVNNIHDGRFYIISEENNANREYTTILGVLEAIGCLSFEMLGGANSQIYIYVNQIQSLRNIINDPYRYDNHLLDMVNDRHVISVKMLTYLFENDLTSTETWRILEDYFLGIIPESVKEDCLKERPEMSFK